MPLRHTLVTTILTRILGKYNLALFCFIFGWKEAEKSVFQPFPYYCTLYAHCSVQCVSLSNENF